MSEAFIFLITWDMNSERWHLLKLFNGFDWDNQTVLLLILFFIFIFLAKQCVSKRRMALFWNYVVKPEGKTGVNDGAKASLMTEINKLFYSTTLKSWATFFNLCLITLYIELLSLFYIDFILRYAFFFRW